MSGEIKEQERRAWDPDNMGFNKHSYRHIDPETINVEDFATNLRGEEQHFGDVRQYNSAYNEKHPENDVDLDDLHRVGSVFETEATGFEGIWHVTNLPIVRSPEVFCRAVKLNKPEDLPEGKEEVTIPCVELGCSVNRDNLFVLVRTKLLKRGNVSRTQRVKLTKKR
jgi:hypothetical protein